MSILTFRGYGVGAHDVSIIAARVTHWEMIDYNGHIGTLIYLDTGAEIKVAPSPWDVEKRIRAALAPDAERAADKGA